MEIYLLKSVYLSHFTTKERETTFYYLQFLHVSNAIKRIEVIGLNGVVLQIQSTIGVWCKLCYIGDLIIINMSENKNDIKALINRNVFHLCG